MRPKIVTFLLFLVMPLGAALAQDDVADVPCKDLTVEKHPDQRFFLIGADEKTKVPEKGLALLLVLPGGDGSADFNPFVKRIWKNALPEGYLVAQLVSVPSKDKNQIVWPTERTKDPKQTFATESFIAAVVSQVKLSYKIDELRVFALAWSSGGPAVYACAFAKETPIKGAFIAMSIFLPSALPKMDNVKDRRFYLFQSPDDRVTRYSSARNAREQLSKAGAKVELKDYDGGHGWHGDVYGNIRAGVDWLEGQ